MDIAKFFTAAEIQNVLTLIARATMTGEEALAYITARQKLIAALNHLKAGNGNNPTTAE